MNNSYKKIKLYFINRLISGLERERNQLSSQRRVDMPLQGLLVVYSLARNISGRLDNLYSLREGLTKKLNTSSTGEAIYQNAN